MPLPSKAARSNGPPKFAPPCHSWPDSQHRASAERHGCARGTLTARQSERPETRYARPRAGSAQQSLAAPERVVWAESRRHPR
jgi:hypothetical protein